MPRIDITLAPSEVAAVGEAKHTQLDDYALIARLLIAKRIRWEPFSSNSGVGELCFDGLRYCTHLDQFGIPELPDNLRHRLLQAESR